MLIMLVIVISHSLVQLYKTAMAKVVQFTPKKIKIKKKKITKVKTL